MFRTTKNAIISDNCKGQFSNCMIQKELLSVKCPKVQFVSWSDIEEVAVIAISGGASIFVQLMEDAWVNLCAMGDAFGQMFSCTSPMSFVCTSTSATSSASCQTMSEVFFPFSLLNEKGTHSLHFPLAEIFPKLA